MKQVTAVGLFCMEQWKGPTLDKTALTEALLLHDMGNIIKFKKPFSGELKKDTHYWEEVQKEYIQKYGNDVHTATIAILHEIGIYPKCLEIVENMKTIAMEHNILDAWEAKIGDFCDTCVTPNGIEGFEKRVEDLIFRYNIPRDSERVTSWKTNAADIQHHLNTNVLTIQENEYSSLIKQVQNMEIRIKK